MLGATEKGQILKPHPSWCCTGLISSELYGTLKASLSILVCRNHSDHLPTHIGFPLWTGSLNRKGDADFILEQQSQNFQIPAVMRVGLRLPCSDSFTNGFSQWCMFTKPSEQLTALSFEERWFYFNQCFCSHKCGFVPRRLAINSLDVDPRSRSEFAAVVYELPPSVGSGLLSAAMAVEPPPAHHRNPRSTTG